MWLLSTWEVASTLIKIPYFIEFLLTISMYCTGQHSSRDTSQGGSVFKHVIPVCFFVDRFKNIARLALRS